MRIFFLFLLAVAGSPWALADENKMYLKIIPSSRATTGRAGMSVLLRAIKDEIHSVVGDIYRRFNDVAGFTSVYAPTAGAAAAGAVAGGGVPGGGPAAAAAAVPAPAFRLMQAYPGGSPLPGGAGAVYGIPPQPWRPRSPSPAAAAYFAPQFAPASSAPPPPAAAPPPAPAAPASSFFETAIRELDRLDAEERLANRLHLGAGSSDTSTDAATRSAEQDREPVPVPVAPEGEAAEGAPAAAEAPAVEAAEEATAAEAAAEPPAPAAAAVEKAASDGVSDQPDDGAIFASFQPLASPATRFLAPSYLGFE